MATAQVRIGPADQGREMTLEEFGDAEAEPGFRYELGRGALEVTEVPGRPHGKIVSNLYMAIARYHQEHPGSIDRFGGGGEFYLRIPAMRSGRHPDLGVVLVDTPLDDRGRDKPALVAEVVSARSKTRDYQTKRQKYLAFGVREYWIIDPYKRQVTTLVRRDGGEAATWEERASGGDDVMTSDVLPRIATTVAELWLGVPMDDEDDGPEP